MKITVITKKGEGYFVQYNQDHQTFTYKLPYHTRKKDYEWHVKMVKIAIRRMCKLLKNK